MTLVHKLALRIITEAAALAIKEGKVLGKLPDQERKSYMQRVRDVATDEIFKGANIHQNDSETRH